VALSARYGAEAAVKILTRCDKFNSHRHINHDVRGVRGASGTTPLKRQTA
jgi:hypothetical protein